MGQSEVIANQDATYLAWTDEHPVGDYAKTREERQAFIEYMVRKGRFGNPSGYEYVDDPYKINPASYMDTKPNGHILVYPKAFDTFDYYGFGSALYHEYNHALRFKVYRSLGFKIEKNTQSHFMIEAEAYKMMTTGANPFWGKVSKGFFYGMRDNDARVGYGGLTPENKARVDRNDFNCAKTEC